MAMRFEKAKEYTQKYKNILQPCRHCGNTDIRIVSDRSIFVRKCNTWSVVCTTPGCDCTAEYTSVRAAVHAWNSKGEESNGE